MSALVLHTEPMLRREDHRGALIKAWPRPVAGEVYVVEILPGTSRGHHLHRHGGEWFATLAGQALLVVVDPNSGARAELLLDGVRARVEAGQAHALFCVGEEPALVLAVSDRLPEDDQTLPHPISAP